MSYRYYRLTRYRGGRDSASTGELRRHIKSLELTMKDYRFSGEDPILIFDFLSRMVEECDILGLTEAQAYVVLPQFLTGKAAKQFRSTRNGARSGGVSCWPEAIQSLLRTYATPAAIREAVTTLRGTRQLVNETEQDFGSRINDAAYRCGNIHHEREKMTLFVDGLAPTTRTIVARFRENEPRSSLTFDRLVQFAQDQGDAYRAQYVQARTFPIRGNKQTREVHFVEESTDNASGGDVNMIIPEDSVATADLPSTMDEDASTDQEQILYASTVRPGFINHGGRSSTPNRVGWMSKNRSDLAQPPLICHQCYEIGHISPKCQLTSSDVAKIITNYEKLSPDHRTLVPATSYRVTQLATQLGQDSNYHNPTSGTEEKQHQNQTQGN